MSVKGFIDKKIKCAAAILALTVAIIVPVAISTANGIRAAVEEYVAVDVLMYHSVLKDSRYQGKYVISPDDLESDLVYLKENGYTTIHVEDLIQYVYNGKELPQKPIILSFDDGYYNNYVYAFELMSKYDMKMSISILTKLTEEYSRSKDMKENYSHVSWDNVNRMIESGRVEILNHSYDLHHTGSNNMGFKKNRGENKDEYKARILSDLKKSQDVIEANTGVRPSTFTYPFGYTNDASMDIVKEAGFRAALEVENKQARITKNPDSLYQIKRFIRPGRKSTDIYMRERGL